MSYDSSASAARVLELQGHTTRVSLIILDKQDLNRGRHILILRFLSSHVKQINNGLMFDFLEQKKNMHAKNNA